MTDVKSLSHSTWRCKYHIVFAPKYRRMAVYGKIRADIGRILRELCERKKVTIIQAEACPDSYPYVSGNTTVFERITVYGVFKK